MLPLRDNNPTRRFPIVNIAIILLNVLVFIYQWLLPSDQLDQMVYQMGVVPARVVSQFSLPVAFTFLSAMFMHGGFLHILGNMLYLYIFGDNVEDTVGHFRYAFVYLACGIGASLAQIAIDPTSTVPSIGASGAIAGVLGAYLVFFPRARIQYLVTLGFFIRFIELPAIIALGLWFVLQIFSGVLSLDVAQSGGVAYFAHIGGFALGLLTGLLCKATGCQPRQPTFSYLGEGRW
jgi:membrane associated rhomboid family serine protease